MLEQYPSGIITHKICDSSTPQKKEKNGLDFELESLGTKKYD